MFSAAEGEPSDLVSSSTSASASAPSFAPAFALAGCVSGKTVVELMGSIARGTLEQHVHIISRSVH